jgi:predicted Ser/Thr protein kinase
MTITTGTQLGPYKVLGPIGAGGMGEVYKALDTRLDRVVAIKILPDHLADRAELRERFEREARTVASLNHPHICTLYDIGRQDGTDYLVMEYLEGETLAQRLAKGSLPLDQVLRYAIEIADALDKAHRKGITHRDLKPGNIMLTKSGTKLLDFGLAKLKQEVDPTTPVSQLPTTKSEITGEGTIVGTLQYMAPEQIEAKEVDARTDIFAFGAVVYEMATGKKAFAGKTSASVMAKILETDPPPMASLQPMTPPALDRVVKKCLAKEPERRWQDASDLCDELKWIAEGGSQTAVSAPAIAPAERTHVLRRWALVSGLACVIVAVVAAFAGWNLKPTPSSAPRPETRLTITLPPGQQLAGLDAGPAVAISPDGTHLAYVATQGGTQRIFLRAMDSLEARPVSDTDGGSAPFFSPDGQWLGFFAGGKLKKISVGGGAAVALASGMPHGAGWGSQGIIAFAPSLSGVLQKVQEAGGTPQPLTGSATGEVSHRWPEFLPDGKAVLFAANASTANWTNPQVAVQSAGIGERRNLIQGATQPRYALSGHLVYAQGGSLLAVPFDPERLTATGAAVPVVEGVLQSRNSGAAQYSFSATGSLVYVPGDIQGLQSRLVWVARNGTEQPLAAPAHAYDRPHLSPDGRRVVVDIEEQETQVWLYDLSRETLTRLTFEGNENEFPTWTPDGKRIAFRSNKEMPQHLFWQLADGSGGLERLTTSEPLPSPSHRMGNCWPS